MINLHVHSGFSLLDSISKPKDIAIRAKELGQEAIAITEHGNMYSYIKHYNACLEQGVKPIIGNEVYITDDLTVRDPKNRYKHLVLIAKNNKGLENLIKITMISNESVNFYYKPRIDYEILEKYSEGIIALTACLQGSIPYILRRMYRAKDEANEIISKKVTKEKSELTNWYENEQDGLEINSDEYKQNNKIYQEKLDKIESSKLDTYDEIVESIKLKAWLDAKTELNRYKDIFGDDLYLEIQSHKDEEQQFINRKIVDLSKETNTKYVVTTDAHYIKESDQEIHSIWVKVGTEREAGETYNDCYIQDDEDVYRICQSTTKEENRIAIENTHEIARQCNVEVELSPPIMPHVKLANESDTELQTLVKLCSDGWNRKIVGKVPESEQPKYVERLKYELDVLTQLDFIGYILLVADYLNAFDEVRVGRGSCVSSLVCYLTDITRADPLKYGLFFERFIDVSQIERIEKGLMDKKDIKIPDIDSDYRDEIRDKTYLYLKNKYGKDHFALVGTFGYVKARNAIDDITRALGYKLNVSNTIKSYIPENTNGTIQEYIDMGVFDEILDDEVYKTVIDYANAIYGLPRSAGIHPGGAVITNKTMFNYAPVRYRDSDNQPILDLDLYDAEELGLVKLDLLGLRTLEVITDVIDELGLPRDYFSDINMEYDREDVFHMFKTGNTDDVFQFESEANKEMLKQVKPESIYELAIANALCRPGAKRLIPTYVKIKQGECEPEYLHPDLKPILENTYSLLIFQEQLISIGKLANMSNPDVLRKMTTGKSVGATEPVKQELQAGLIERGWDIETVETMWNEILNYNQYSFNLSHSIAYSILSYITAQLKLDYPLHYMSAVINSYSKHSDKLTDSINSAIDMGLEIVVPRWNKVSGKTWTDGKRIYLGFNVIKGFNENKGNTLFEVSKTIDKNMEFLDLISTIQTETEKYDNKITNSNIKQMIELDMFHDYGSISELLELLEVSAYKNRVSIKKSTIKNTPFTPEQIRKYAANETEKSFTKVDFESVIDEYKPKSKTSVVDRIIGQSTYLGSPLETIPNVNTNMIGILIDIINTGYNLIFKFFSIKTGMVIEFKNKSKNIKVGDFEKGDIVYITNFNKSRRWKAIVDDNGKESFIQIDDLEFICYGMFKVDKSKFSEYILK